MVKKIYYIFIIAIITAVVLGLCINNIVLNRNIYCNEIHMKSSEVIYRNRKNKYNLDDMEKKLDLLEDKMDNPYKYKSEDTDIVFKVYVPRFRIFFSLAPLDLRFETKNYKIYINNSMINNIKNQIAYTSNLWGNIFKNIRYDINGSDEKLHKINSTMLELKQKIYNTLK